MKSFTKVVLSFGFLVLLVVAMYAFSDWFSKTTGYVLGDDEKAHLAQCLTEKNTVLYSKDDCLECQNQLELFGNSIDFLVVVDCDSTHDGCGGLRSLPSWQINNEFYYGIKTLDELIELSQCNVKNE